MTTTDNEQTTNLDAPGAVEDIFDAGREYQRRVAVREAIASCLPTVNRPCPPWCELRAGHGWDSGTEGVDDSRGHGLTVGYVQGTSASVSLLKRRRLDAGAFPLGRSRFSDQPGLLEHLQVA